MNVLKNFTAIACLSAVLFSCDTEMAPAPEVFAPASQQVLSGAEITLSFGYTAEGGFSSSEISNEQGGTAVVSTDGEAGATAGTLEVTFTAGANAGAASFTLIVTDGNGNSDDVTAVLTVEEELSIIQVAANIDGDVTWETGKTYVLGGRITVLDGATLTIQPGVIVKGEAGTGSNATALLVARGGTLNAEGTAALPILFTSVADEITPEDVAAGNFASPNLGADVSGLWGGVIILGKAPISASNDNDEDVSEVQIEGIPTSDTNGLYGGSQAADNSGTITYISIRHGGSNIGSGNEINGLTLGGVGSGTTISNVEVVGNQDDGIEFFGGTVNVSNAVVWNVNDDAIDTDQSWSGTLDNFVVIAPNTAGAHCFELDGPEGTLEAGHTIMNGSIFASFSVEGEVLRQAEDLINTDANSIVNLSGLYFDDVLQNQLINRTVGNPGVTFSGIELNVPAAELNNYIEDGDAPAGISSAGAPSNGVGADLTQLTWTWASQDGRF